MLQRDGAPARDARRGLAVTTPRVTAGTPWLATAWRPSVPLTLRALNMISVANGAAISARVVGWGLPVVATARQRRPWEAIRHVADRYHLVAYRRRRGRPSP